MFYMTVSHEVQLRDLRISLSNRVRINNCSGDKFGLLRTIHEADGTCSAQPSGRLASFINYFKSLSSINTHNEHPIER